MRVPAGGGKVPGRRTRARPRQAAANGGDLRTEAGIQRGRRREKVSKRTAGSPGTLEPARWRKGRLEAAANRAGARRPKAEGIGPARSLAASSGQFRRREGAAWRAGADGVDGVLRGGRSRRRGAGNGAEDVGHGSRLGFGLDPEKRGSGVGEREIAQVRVDVVHLTSRRARESDGRLRGMAPVRGREEKERLTVGGEAGEEHGEWGTSRSSWRAKSPGGDHGGMAT